MTHPNTHRIRLTALLAACLVPLAVAPARAADPAAQPSAQDIRDRLLGRDGAPSNGSSAAPAQPAGGPDCSTQAALESNPACFNQVSGADRGFSLVGPRGSGAHAAAPAAGPRAGGASPRAPAHQAAASGRRTTSGAAGGCGLSDTSNAHGVNLCITFGLNSSTLTPTARSHLDRLYEALAAPELRSRSIRIEGYADISGNAQANQTLSAARAQAAADYLVTKGLSRDHVEAQGYGSSHLLPGRAPTDPANRRVEARLKD
ncbi:OmpA family protein [Caulobacter sp. KR2-114]|uniref:OmpA family protein n=1 Tax=Caulobacter sp. KR2-114 TaxID=3400912 RepID=UPI003C0F3B58